MKNEAAQQTLAVRLLAGALARRWEGPVFGAGCASCRVSLVINYHIPGPRIARGWVKAYNRILSLHAPGGKQVRLSSALNELNV